MVRFGSQVRPRFRRTFWGVDRNLAMTRQWSQLSSKDTASPGGGVYEVNRVVGVLQWCHGGGGVSQGTGEGGGAEDGHQVQVDERVGGSRSDEVPDGLTVE